MMTWPPSHGAIQNACFSIRCAPVRARTAPIANSTRPTTIATASFHVVSNPPQYMIRLAQQNAAGSRILGIGTRYERGRPASMRCSAASDTGAKAYMMAVAAVTTATSAFQLLKGPNARMPTTAATMIEGTADALLYLLPNAPALMPTRA